MTDKDCYIMFRRICGFERFPNYVKWFHNLFVPKGWDAHHLLSSLKGHAKFTDALIHPFPHEFHLGTVEKNKPYYMVKHLNQSFMRFRSYCSLVLGVDLPIPPIEAETGLYDPHKVNGLIKLIAEKQNA